MRGYDRPQATMLTLVSPEQRVPANGLPVHQSLSRTTLIAAAVRTCWRCALASPI